MKRATVLDTGVLLLLFAWARPSAGQESISANVRPDTDSPKYTFSPNERPALRAPASRASDIVLDGILDDAAWLDASVATNFSETFPGDQTEPPIEIKALLTYDDENLYIGFKIQDDPAQIRTSLTDRDHIWQDDYVGVLLDTYASNSWCYFIASNPFGIQGDTRIVQGGNEDVGFNVVFESEGQITEDGYSVEMKIPFRSLSFPDAEKQEWNLNFWITHPRESRSTYSWAAIDRDDPCWLCQFGSVDEIRGVSAGNNLEFLPALVGGEAGALDDTDDPNSEFVNESIKIEPSLGVKYAFNSNIIGDLALNPDFSQVEADAAQIDVNTTFALFFPERRPFFQEGSELYETEIQTVYTRTINNPDVAGKTTGRFGSGNGSYLGAIDANSAIIVPFEEQSGFVDAGRAVSNIARYKKTYEDGSYVGGLVTDKRYWVGGSGTTAGFDGSYRFLNNYSIQGQFVGSYTAEPNDPELTDDEDLADLRFGQDDQYTAVFDGEAFAGFSGYLNFERDSRFWNFDLEYKTASPTFRADAGFVNRNNTHSVSFWNGFNFWPAAGFVDQIQPYVFGSYQWNYQGIRKDEYVWAGFWGRFKGQTNAGVEAQLFSNERFKDIEFSGIRRLYGWFESNFSDPVKLGSEFLVGKQIARGEDVPVLGNGLNYSFWGTLRPSSRFQIQPSLNFSRLNHPETGEPIFDGYIGRVRMNYQFTRRFFLRLIAQYNDFDKQIDVDPLFTYRVNPFTAFYLGSTHDYRDFDEEERGYVPMARQFFFKVQYLIRA